MDTTVLIGRRPSGQRKQLIVSGVVSLNQPAPGSATDPLYVVLSGIPLTFAAWPLSHGSTLPVAGATVRVAYDQQGVPYVDSWDGVNVVGLSFRSFAVPALASFSISHMLARLPVGPTFYDASGHRVDVGFQATDVDTLVVTQGSPVAGTVVMG